MNPSFLMFDHEIDLVFQPIVSIERPEIYSYECLVRFTDREPHETQETINFIETSGRALLLDRRVSLRLLDSLNDLSFLDGSPISMNITGHSVSSTTYLNWFESFVKRIKEPSRLIVELTETLPISDIKQSRIFFDFCRSKGIFISLDDYGTGHSHIERLHELPFRGAKLDGDFVLKWHECEKSLSVAKELVELSESFGLTTTAEFVSSIEDINRARMLGYHNAQGHFIGRPECNPTPPTELLKNLTDQGMYQ